jgi:predicted phosphodiesterase
MRVAIVSDIHGNLLALDAVVADIERQGVDQVWCGGDIGWGGPWASECIARVREYGWPTVRGNADVWITGDPQTIADPEKRKTFEEIAAQHAISEDDARWLLSLPIGHTGPGSLLLVHGTPSSPFDAPDQDSPSAAFQPFEDGAGLTVFAHVHRAFVRRLRDGTLVANSGSVGLPLDGTTACYLIVENTGPEVVLVHRRVAFDRRAGMAQAKVMGGPAADLFLSLLGTS